MAVKKRKPRKVKSNRSDPPARGKKSAARNKKPLMRKNKPNRKPRVVKNNGSDQPAREKKSMPRNKMPLVRENKPKGNPRNFDNARMQSTIGMGSNRDLDPDHPPMTNIESIIDRMVKRLKSPDFKPVFGNVSLKTLMKPFEGRAVKVVTMCSGTEAPILALGMFREALARREGKDFNFWHVASAEIEPFKQAYIQRNFEDSTIFADVRDFSNPENQKTRVASTAYGGMQNWPEGIHILVAGSMCVDFSNLNKNRTDELDLKGAGKSESTLAGVLDYCDKVRPAGIILENVKGCPWDKFENKLREINYDCKTIHLDTKNFGLPQTRERGYMLCYDQKWAAETGFDTAIARDFATNIMKLLQLRATSPFVDFVFSEEDDYLQQFREPEHIARNFNPSTKTVGWEACRLRYKDYREKHALGNARPITHWSENGQSRYPDYTWIHWAKNQRPRVHDSIDIHYLNSARDNSKRYDAQYKHRCVELSQNIDRDEDTRPMGIVGCITPTGNPYLTTRGGPMDGREALALQGLPLKSMSLPIEGSRQLQNFAGNAMSTPVVGAAVIAMMLSVSHQHASVSSQKGKKKQAARLFFKQFADEAQHLKKLTICPASLSEADLIKEAGDWVLEKFDFLTKAQNDDSNALPFKLINLGSTAGRYCLCEGFRHMSRHPIKLCKDCGETACDGCADIPRHNYDTSLEHSLNDTVRADASRLIAAAFDMLPHSVQFSTDCSTFQWKPPKSLIKAKRVKSYRAAVNRAFDGELHLQYVRRGGVLRALYASKNAELELSLVRARADSLGMGTWHLLPSFTLQWRLFAKPGPSEPAGSILTKVLREPLARMNAIGDLTEGLWQIRDPEPVQLSLKVSANIYDMVKSWRNALGLRDRIFQREARYRTINISFASADLLKNADVSAIEGSYTLLENCGTAESSLYVRRTEDQMAGERLYLMVDPDPLGDGPDSMVFVHDPRRITRDERRVIVGRLQSGWRPIDSRKWKLELPSSRESDFVAPGTCGIGHIVTQDVKCKFSRGWIDNETIELSSYVPDKHGWEAKPGPITVRNDHKHDKGNTLLLLDIPSEAVNPFWPEGLQTQIAVRDKPTALEDLRWLTTSAIRIDDPTEYETMVHVREPRGTDAESYLFRGNGRRTSGTSAVNQEWFEINLTELTTICQTCHPKLPDFEWENRKVAKGRTAIVAPKYKADTANSFERNLRQVPNAVTATVHRLEGNNVLQVSFNLIPPALSMLSRLIGHYHHLEEGVQAKWTIAKSTNIAPLINLSNLNLASNKNDPSNLQLTASSFRRQLWVSQKQVLLWMVEKEGRDDAWMEVEREEINVEALGKRFDLEVSRGVKMQSGILADQVGAGKTTTCFALVGTQKTSAAPAIIDYKTGAIATNATLILVPKGILRQWETEFNQCFVEGSLKLVCFKTPDQVLKAKIEDVQQADVILVSFDIFDNDRYWNNVRHIFDANYRPAKAGRGFQHWLRDVQHDLEKFVGSFEDDDLQSNTKMKAAATIRELQDSSKYARYEPKVRPTDLQHKQGKKFKAKPKASQAVSTNRDQAGVLKDRIPLLLHMFRWKRLIVDEFPFLDGKALLSILQLQADHRWMISGTPPVENFDSVETLAQLVGTKVSSHYDDDGIFSFVKNQFKVANDRNFVEDFRALSMIRSENFVNLRNADAQKFVWEHVRQNKAPAAKSVDHSTTIVQVSAVERLAYLLINRSLEDNVIPVGRGKKGMVRTKAHTESVLTDYLLSFPL